MLQGDAPSLKHIFFGSLRVKEPGGWQRKQHSQRRDSLVAESAPRRPLLGLGAMVRPLLRCMCQHLPIRMHPEPILVVSLQEVI